MLPKKKPNMPRKNPTSGMATRVTMKLTISAIQLSLVSAL